MKPNLTRTSANNDSYVITPNTSLSELLTILGDVVRADKTPTAKALREMAGESIVQSEDGCITVYANGYAVYDNGTGRTVLWLPMCKHFTYQFDELTEAEKQYQAQKAEISEEEMLILPWTIPVTLVGEHRISANLMNRTGSRTGTTDFDSADKGDKDGDAEEAVEEKDPFSDAYVWREGRFGESPEMAYIRKEAQEERLSLLTDKQREVFEMYYHDGFNQYEIAEILDIDQTSVRDRLDAALKKIKKSF